MRDHRPPARRLPTATSIAVACLLAFASAADAQSIHPWRIDASVGAFVDPYDAGLDDNQTGALAGLSVSRGFGPNFRATLSLAGARVGDVGSSSTYKYRGDWVFLTGGPQVDVPLSRLSLSVALETGAAWTRAVNTGITPPPEQGGDRRDWSLKAALVPSVQLRLPVTARLSVTGSASTYLINWPDRPHNGPAFGLGLAFQP